MHCCGRVWQQCLAGGNTRGPSRATRCQALSNASAGAAKGAQEGPAPWTSPGPRRRVSQHRKTEHTLRSLQGQCPSLLFFPAVTKMELPNLSTITLVLRKFFHFCLLSIKVPVLSPSLASPAVKAHAGYALLPLLSLWLSCTHPSLYIPVPLFLLLLILFFTSSSSSTPLPVFCS